MSKQRKITIENLLNGRYHYSINSMLSSFVTADALHEAADTISRTGPGRYSETIQALAMIYTEHYKTSGEDLVGKSCYINWVSPDSLAAYEIEVPSDVDVVYIDEQAKPDEPEWFDTGDANFYRLMMGGEWFGVLQLNGQMTTSQQEDFLNRHFKKGIRP